MFERVIRRAAGVLVASCAAFVVVLAQAPASGDKVPITTASNEARKLYVDGRDLLERLRGTDGRRLFEQAAAKDPGFALAFVGLANTAGTNREFDTAVYRLTYESPVTPSSVYDYDPATRKRTLLKQYAVLGGYDPSRYKVELMRATGRSLDSLRDLGMEELALLEPSLPEPHFRRARHVVSENARTEQAARVLTRGELAPFGELMNASHASLRDDYEASAPELDHLVDVAQRQAGVLGARLTGGGFGGSALVLVQTPALERVSAVLGASYWERFRKKATFRSARASSGARAEPSPS